jgi:hypothetical protein
MLCIWAIISANWVPRTQKTKTVPFVISTAYAMESPHRGGYLVWIISEAQNGTVGSRLQGEEVVIVSFIEPLHDHSKTLGIQNLPIHL